ncbi:XIAP-associated factor 1 [Alligator sinensis]|uniref:XIAP-associated factor 1 n=1 Tax=Alligator sinensis TaxID=38654 RepID=A0A1U8DML0_ALLSI|nr:XIAP-associated factor 1 [Alligator sinensis]
MKIREPDGEIKEVKKKEGQSPRAAMEDESKFCPNCKQDVSAANFSLHEIHCQRFLTVCPDCKEAVAQKEMREHQANAHKQVRCKLCHQSLQQYQLENHETVECSERVMKCKFCELEMPFAKLQEHLDSCGSRTEKCFGCNKYIMYKDLDQHKDICRSGDGLSNHGLSDKLCQLCNKSFPDDQFLQHLNQCSPLAKLVGSLASLSATNPSPLLPPTAAFPATTSSPVNAAAWRDVRPKGKDKDLSSASRTSLKPPKNKKSPGHPAFSTTLDPVLPQALEDTGNYDILVTCARCNILLPLPTLKKHEIKCLHSASLQNVRRKSKSSPEKQEESF